MSAEESRLRVKKDKGIVHIEFVDRNILDEANIQQIGEELSRIVESETQPRVVISFQNVDHLSSAALGTLITVNSKIRNRNGQLRLADIDPQIFEVFVITRLNRLFSIHDTSAEAMDSFS